MDPILIHLKPQQQEDYLNCYCLKKTASQDKTMTTHFIVMIFFFIVTTSAFVFLRGIANVTVNSLCPFPVP